MIKEEGYAWRLGEILLQRQWISWERLEQALQIQLESGRMKRHVVRKKNSTVWFLGELLIKQGWVSWDGLDMALQAQKDTGRLLGGVLVDRGLTTETNLFRALAIQFNVAFIDFGQVSELPADTLRLVPKRFVYDYHIMPLVAKDGVLLVAISDPLNIQPEIELQKLVKDYQIRPVLACPTDIDKAIQRYYGSE